MNKYDMMLKIMEQESQIELLSNMYDNIRGFRHDFSNLVQALYGYVQLNDMSGIKKVIGSVMKEWNNVNEQNLLYLNDIQNPAICSILSSKYWKAKEDSITIEIQISASLKDLKDNQYNVCRIMAILLDNAIEAASFSKEKKVNISIYQENMMEKRIRIENSYYNKEIDIHQIFEKGYSSKKEGIGHGLGLWNVKKLLEHHDNLSLLTQKDTLFSQELVIHG